MGEETKAPNKKYLIKRIVEALEQEEGQEFDASKQDDIQRTEPDDDDEIESSAKDDAPVSDGDGDEQTDEAEEDIQVEDVERQLEVPIGDN